MQVRLAEIWDIAFDTGQHPRDIPYRSNHVINDLPPSLIQYFLNAGGWESKGEGRLAARGGVGIDQRGLGGH